MSDGALHVLSLIAAIAGMFAFALANDGHWKQVFGAKPRTAAALTVGKSAGVALLALSFGLCAMADPISMALLVWPMLLALAAAAIAAFLTARSQRSTIRKRNAR